MSQPIDTETNIRKKVSDVLVERTIRNAVVAIEAEKLQPTKELVIQMVRMIDQMRAIPTSPSESVFATQALNRAIKEIETGHWDDKIQAGAKHWTDG